MIDGAKALAGAVRAVFGAAAAVQRCTLHKRRNVADHLPDKEKAWVDAKHAERSFRRVKGYKQMPALVAALHRHAHPAPANNTETVGAVA